MCSVEQIIEYRLAREQLVSRLDPPDGTLIDTPEGKFNLIAYQSTIDLFPWGNEYSYVPWSIVHKKNQTRRAVEN